MDRCSLCNGRLVKTEYGHRCLNANCENAQERKQSGQLCNTCNNPLEFKRNNAYGDRSYWCDTCQKEVIL